MNAAVAQNIKRCIYNYRAYPHRAATESSNPQRMELIKRLDELDWKISRKEHKHVKTPKMVIVVDTEFLLCNLQVVADIIDHLSPHVWLVLPWAVVKEVDVLKTNDDAITKENSMTLGDLAIQGIYLVHHLISNGHPSVVGQQLHEMVSNEKNYLDRMADCARYYKQKVCANLVYLSRSKHVIEKIIPFEIEYVSEIQGLTVSELLNILTEKAFKNATVESDELLIE
ncbi:hypothetical protein MP638_004161 [Amoeboaphelidium occidentale]|nr:hypothetical protein MP638_004161 [Amoeboaphelidium occidentale]